MHSQKKISERSNIFNSYVIPEFSFHRKLPNNRQYIITFFASWQIALKQSLLAHWIVEQAEGYNILKRVAKFDYLLYHTVSAFLLTHNWFPIVLKCIDRTNSKSIEDFKQATTLTYELGTRQNIEIQVSINLKGKY